MQKMLEAIAVTCELTNTTLSKAAVKVIAEELCRYPEPHVLGALRKCCKELKGRLTLAEIVLRLDDGRPGVEEAWALLSTVLRNESASVVWTDEIREAYGVVLPLVEDPVAARMAFKERYAVLLSEARDRRDPVRWSVSLGYDKAGRELALAEAVKRNQISQQHAASLLPVVDAVHADVQALLEQIGK